MAYSPQTWDNLPLSVTVPVAERMQTLEYGLQTAAAVADAGGGGGGGAALDDPVLRSLIQMPDPVVAERIINPQSMTLTYSNTSATTSIASGITVVDMAGGTAALTAKASLCGTQASQLEVIAAGYLGPTWNQSLTNGQYNYEGGGPNTPWRIRFIAFNTQYVEVLGGLGVAGGIVAYVDGRKLVADSTSMSGAGSVNNKFKIDFGSGNTGWHLVELNFHWTFSLAKIFVGAGGMIYPAPSNGLKAGLISDSSGNVDTISAGDHLDFYFHRFMAMTGFEDYYMEPLGGRGTGVGYSNYSSFIGTATNSPIKSQGIDVLFAGTAYGNDKIQSRTTTQASNDLQTFLTTVAAWTKPPLVVLYGMWDPTGANGTAYTNYDAVCIPKAAAAGAAYIALTTGNVYPFGSTTAIASLGPLITTTNLATTIFTGDNLHFTVAGHVHFAGYMFRGWTTLLKAAMS